MAEISKGSKGTLVLWAQAATGGLTLDGVLGAKSDKAIPAKYKDFPNITKNGNDSTVCWLLPRKGAGFRTYGRDGNDQFGTESTIARIMDLAEKFEPILEIGNISRYYGGQHLPHKSHKTGKQIDIRPIRKDGKTGEGLTYHSPTYSQKLTQEFVNLAKKTYPGITILFNGPKIKGVRAFAGHDNHLHLDFTAVKGTAKLSEKHFAQMLAENPFKSSKTVSAAPVVSTLKPSSAIFSSMAALDDPPDIIAENETDVETPVEASVFEQVSKVSNSSNGMAIYTQVLAVGAGVWAFLKDNPILILAVVLLAVAGLWFYNESKKRAQVRTLELKQ